ncbi:MAG: hypothetical protein KAY54_08805 [Burkholderiaceae bacterium]|nr:hypothetical protein [Burkholderiaceae bacterium]
MPTNPTIPLPGSLELHFRIAGEDLTVRLVRKAKVAGDPIATATANTAVVALSGNELRVGKARFWIPADSLPKARALVAQLERAP